MVGVTDAEGESEQEGGGVERRGGNACGVSCV